MPQTPLPNMGLIRPNDKGDGDVWDFLLDNMFQLIDAHSHAPGAGAKINLTTVKPDGDYSMIDTGNVKRAIKGLGAIQFSRVPNATPYAGAFFIADGTALGLAAGELYYRSVNGDNIQFTSGTIMNINAFTGGIGGDYGAVAALESYVDATNNYTFQQQLQAGVRQFAKVKTADLTLFEFRVHGTTPTPAFGVTLASPVALAAGYTLTMPVALPVGAQPAPMALSSSGAIIVGGVQVLNMTGLDFVIQTGTGTASYGAGTIISTSAVTLLCGVPLREGDRITTVTANFGGNGTVDITDFTVFKFINNGASSSIGTTTVSNITLVDTTINVTDTAIGAGDTIFVQVIANAANLVINNLRVTYDHP